MPAPPSRSRAVSLAPPTWVGKALLAIALLFLLQAAEAILLPLAVAILLTFLLFGPVRALTRLGVPPALGAALVVAALLGTIGFVGSTLAGPASEWWARAPANLQQVTQTIDRLRMAIPGLEPPRRRSRYAAPPPDPLKEKLASEGFTITRAVLSHFWHFVLAGGVTVIALYFLLASEYKLLSRTVQALPNRRTRVRVLAGVRQAQREVGQYLATTGLINIVLGLATGVVLDHLGLPNPLLWGALVAALNFVPYLGPMLVAGALLLAGILTYDRVLDMAWPALSFLALHAIESNFVTPMVVGRRLRLNPMAVFLSVMLWGWIWGVAGAFIAVPMLLAIRAACRRIRGAALVYSYLYDNAAVRPVSLSLLVAAKARRARQAARASASVVVPAPAMSAPAATTAMPASTSPPTPSAPASLPSSATTTSGPQ
jgi:predicted PurR-regulated permease PerM